MDQISADNLTQGAPTDEDEATRTARWARNQRKEARRVHVAERARIPPRNLNNEFNNVGDPVFKTPIAAMTEATLRLMTMPQNPKLERVAKSCWMSTIPTVYRGSRQVVTALSKPFSNHPCSVWGVGGT